MSKQFYKASIEDIQNNNCSQEEADVLIDVLIPTIKQMAKTLARKSWFELADFYNSKERNIAGFTLMIERKQIADAECFFAIFENATQKLEVMATLEKA